MVLRARIKKSLYWYYCLILQRTNHMEKLNFKELLAYYQGELTEKRNNEIKKIIEENVDFKDVINGLAKIEKELKEDETIEKYFKTKKDELLKRIFDNKK